MRKFNNIFVTHQKISSTRKNAGPRLMSTNKPDWSSMSVSALTLTSGHVYASMRTAGSFEPPCFAVG